MIALTLAELCQSTQSTLLPPLSPSSAATAAADAADAADAQCITCISTSSKDIHKDESTGGGTLFVPLKGERFDGHDFILDAMRHGAVAVASNKSEEQLQNGWTQEQKEEYLSLREHCALLLCSDTLRFLGLCGKAVRERSKALIGAITGSCGKTSVKEMCASIVSLCGPTLFTAGNYNNDVGVPLTLLRLEKEHQFAIIEQGASHLKDIERTCEFVKADFALITNVGQAHILGFGSRAGVYEGKSEILHCLFAEHQHDLAPTPVPALQGRALERGIGIVPADSEWFASWQRDFAEQMQKGKLLSFGESENATMQVSDIVEQAESIAFHLHCKDERYPLDASFKLNILGRHNAINAAGAALLSLVMGAREKEVVQGLNAAQLIKGRLTPQHFGALSVIDDAYNASFNAVKSAIDTLSKQEGKRVLILGDMGELGEEEISLHEEVGRYALGKIDLLLCIGPLSQYCVQAMGHQAYHFLKHGDLIQVLQAYVAENLEHQQKVTCLVKGSHAMHMEQVVTALQEQGQQYVHSQKSPDLRS